MINKIIAHANQNINAMPLTRALPADTGIAPTSQSGELKKASPGDATAQIFSKQGASQKVVVIGLGPIGALMILMLHRFSTETGITFDIQGFDQSPEQDFGNVKSTNLALSARMEHLLKLLELDGKLPKQVPMSGRGIHSGTNPVHKASYTVPGTKDEGASLGSISRNRLSQALAQCAKGAIGNENIHHGYKLTNIKFDRKGQAQMLEFEGGTTINVADAWVIGADGANSTVHQMINKFYNVDERAKKFWMTYREYLVRASQIENRPGAPEALSPDCFHIWSVPNMPFFAYALPNADGSINVNLLGPGKSVRFEEGMWEPVSNDNPSGNESTGKASNDSLPGNESPDDESTGKVWKPLAEMTPSEVKSVLDILCEDVSDLINVDEQHSNPVSGFYSRSSEFWYLRNVVTVGDAAHPMPPFYGLGVNTGAGDVTAFYNLMSKMDATGQRLNLNPSCLFPEFQSERKRNTDAITRMSTENAQGLCSAVTDPHQAKKREWMAFFELTYPDLFLDPHTMGSFRTHEQVSFADMEWRGKVQQQIINACIEKDLNVPKTGHNVDDIDINLSVQAYEAMVAMTTGDIEGFMKIVSRGPDELISIIDKFDPIIRKDLFDLGDVTIHSGHSLGAVFKPSKEAIERVSYIRKQHLHNGHFMRFNTEGNWFDCDLEPNSTNAVKPWLGFDDNRAFAYGRGLSENLVLAASALYRLRADGHAKVLHLGGEFLSDQRGLHSVIAQKLETAREFNSSLPESADDLVVKVPHNEKLIYSEERIIQAILDNIDTLSMIVLPGIVFNTGQRIDVDKILNHKLEDGRTLKELLEEHGVVIGLDLAHSVANRPIDLKGLGVHFAVGAAYKHACQEAGADFGIYVRPDIEGKFLQGWKAVNTDAAFSSINADNREETYTKGAWATRISNPPPSSIVGTQAFFLWTNYAGVDRLVSRSECLTRFFLYKLRKMLGSDVTIITPEDPKRRGATIAFSIKGLEGKFLKSFEKFLMDNHNIEVDIRPPQVLRFTAHYGYNTFSEVANFANLLGEFGAKRKESQ